MSTLPSSSVPSGLFHGTRTVPTFDSPPIKVNGVKVSPWMPDPDGPYCCMRVVLGTNPSVVANRVAFIEKTPRVRVAPYTGPAGDEIQTQDWKNWKYGSKGVGGSDGHIPANELYGFYPPSREWCDAELVQLGYVLT